MKNISKSFSQSRIFYSLLMAASAAVLIASVYFVQGVKAEDSSSITSAANTLRISPVRTDLEFKPGERKVVRTLVTNLTDNAISVRPSMNDFVAGGETGAPALILEDDEFAPSHSLKRFMLPVEDFVIPANGSKEVEVTIVVPADAKPGGYYGAVRFSPSNPDGGGQVNLSASVASIILGSVPGDVVQKLSLANFEIKQGEKVDGLFLKPENLAASFRFSSESDVHLSPFGKVSVKNRDQVVYETDFNSSNPREMILPDSSRRWDVPLKDIGSFGKYEVHATFTYGSSNQTIEVFKTFWVVPLAVIIAAVVSLIVLIGVIVWVAILMKNRKQQGGRSRRR